MLNIALIHFGYLAKAEGVLSAKNDEWNDFSSFKNEKSAQKANEIPSLPDLPTAPVIPLDATASSMPPLNPPTISEPIPGVDQSQQKPTLSGPKDRPLTSLVANPQLTSNAPTTNPKQIKPVNLKNSNKEIDEIDQILDAMPRDEIDHNLEAKIAKILSRSAEKEHVLYRPGSKKVRTVYDYRDETPSKFYLEHVPDNDKNTHLPAYVYQKNYSQMLFAAVAEENLPAIRSLLKKGADINAQTIEVGLSPLMIAVKMNRTNSVRYLLMKGANVNLQNKDGRTALHYAAINDLLKVFELLIQSGAKINLKDKDGKIATDFVNLGQQNKYFLTLAQNVEHYNSSLIDLVEAGNTVGVSFLTERGADVNQVNANGDTPLIIAARKKDSKMVGLLLAQGANVEPKNKQGTDAFTMAVKNNDYSSSVLIETAIISKELSLGLGNRKVLHQVAILNTPKTNPPTNAVKSGVKDQTAISVNDTSKPQSFFDKVKNYLNTSDQPKAASNENPLESKDSFMSIFKADSRPVNKELYANYDAEEKVGPDFADVDNQSITQDKKEVSAKEKKITEDKQEDNYHEPIEVKQINHPNDSESNAQPTEEFSLQNLFKNITGETETLAKPQTPTVIDGKNTVHKSVEANNAVKGMPPAINKPISITPDSFYKQSSPSS